MNRKDTAMMKCSGLLRLATIIVGLTVAHQVEAGITNFTPTAQSVNEDTTYQTNFWLIDSSHDVTTSSSNTLVVQNSGVTVTVQTPTRRRLNVTPVPNATGTTRITLVSTNDPPTTNSFQITFNQVNDNPTNNMQGSLTMNEDTSAQVTTTVSDVESSDSSVTLVADTSSNTNILPLSSITITNGSGGYRTVNFDPKPNAYGTVTITFVTTDTFGPPGGYTNDLVITVNNVPDAPVVDELGVIEIVPSTAIDSNIFKGIEFSDVDSSSLIATVRLVTTTLGTLDNDSALRVVSGTISSVTNTLRTLGYKPTPGDGLAPGIYTQEVVISVTDGSTTPIVITTNFLFQNIGSSGIPEFNFLNSGSYPDTGNFIPFNVQVNNTATNYILVMTQITDRVGIHGALLFPNPGFTGSATSVDGFVNTLEYIVSPQSALAPTNICYDFTLIDAATLLQATSNKCFTLTGANDNPSIADIFTGLIRITDEEVEQPFKSVRLIDPDLSGNQPVQLTIYSTTTNALGQSMARFYVDGFPAYGTNTTLVMNIGSVTQAQAVARAVVIEPITGTIPVGDTEVLDITIILDDLVGTPASDSQTRVEIFGINGAPDILGVPPPAGQPVRINPSDPRPFQKVSIADDDTNVVVTLTLDNSSKGTLTSIEPEFIPAGGGVYVFTSSIDRANIILTSIVYNVNPAYSFPTNQPGLSSFNIEVSDSLPNTSTRDLSIVLVREPWNWEVTVGIDSASTPGSLRWILNRVEPGDFITFALPSYPATIRLFSPLQVLKDLTILGPGADKLALSGDSNIDGSPDVRIFETYAHLAIKGITLEQGRGLTGGGVYVGSGGQLDLSYSAVVGCRADQWGGAIDVEEGALHVYQTLFRSNSLDSVTGKGGGAISIYSDQDCSILNSTFSANRQNSPDSPSGGGAIFAENFTPGTIVEVQVDNCSFLENVDVVDQGNAILVNDADTEAYLRNNIFADGTGKNLEVQGGVIVSQGGNISDDNTRTVLLVGGIPNNITLLDHPTDLIDTDPVLDSFNASLKPTGGYVPLTGSPAIDAAYQSIASVDQRGNLRDGAPDRGSMEKDAFSRIVLNEVLYADEAQFVEFYVPRNSFPFDLQGLSFYVDGTNMHTFTSQTVIQPGFGMVITPFDSFTLPAGDPAPAELLIKTNIFSLSDESTVELRTTNTSAQSVLDVLYLGRMVDYGVPTYDTLLGLTNQSLALYPEFGGFAYLPLSTVANDPGATNTPGATATAVPFGGSNSPPVAVNDAYDVYEDEVIWLPAVANDFDADNFDLPVIVDLSSATDPNSGSVITTNSLQGALLTLVPTNLPVQGTNVVYDPRVSATIQALPLNAELPDEFYYEIKELGSGPIDEYIESPTNASETIVVSPSHRVGSSQQVIIQGSDLYDGTYTVLNADTNTFTISAFFAGNPAATNGNNGSWKTTFYRSTDQSEGRVSVRVIGQNDPPSPAGDFVPGLFEDSIVRILAKPELSGSNIVYGDEGSYSNVPVILTNDLLSNDNDIDTDDSGPTLDVVGVLPSVNFISNYFGSAGVSPVTVHAPLHGLNTEDEILISGYGGHPSYNGYHTVTVVNADFLTIPVTYVDNNASKGDWAVLKDTNRLYTVTPAGVPVTIVLRADPTEDHLLYEPHLSGFLNQLSEGDVYTDSFYYAVSDRHGAVSFAPVEVEIFGVNDTPIPVDDPSGLSILDPLVTASNPITEVLQQLDLMYLQPASSGSTNRQNVHAFDTNGVLSGTVIIQDIWYTDERTSIEIRDNELTGNDGEVDTNDVLDVTMVDTLTREGASLTLTNGIINYNPGASSNLNALARDELLLDTFNVVVTDSNTAGSVTSMVSVLVVGLNDTPIAQDDYPYTTEDLYLQFNPLTFPDGTVALHDIEYDIDQMIPDNRLLIDLRTNFFTPGDADAELVYTSLYYDPTVSEFLNELADWQSYTDIISYTVNDHSMIFAVDDLFEFPNGSTNVVLDVLANDKDFTGFTGTLQIASAGISLRGGIVSIHSNLDYLVYSPPGGFVGDDIFVYYAQNELGDIDKAVVRIRSIDEIINGELKGANDRFVVSLGQTVTLDVLANDNVRPDFGAPMLVRSIISSTLPDQPTVSDGAIQLAATTDVPQVTFTYEATAGGTAAVQAVAVVDIINRQGTLPVQDDAFSVNGGSQSNLLDVLSNDAYVTAPITQLLISGITMLPTHGTASVDPAGTGILYTPDSNFIGVDHVEYVASDQQGGTGTGSVSIAVGSIKVGEDSFTLPINTGTLFYTELEVLANDRLLPHPEATLTITDVSPSNTPIGDIRISTNGLALEFQQGASIGLASFTYTVVDGGTPSRTNQGSLTVNVVGDSVNANPDEFYVLANSETNDLFVLLNDVSVPDTNRIYTVAGVGAGANAPAGAVSVVSNKLVYTPPAGFVGLDDFTYTMSDAFGTDVAGISVRIVRGDLVANEDYFRVYYEVPDGSTNAASFTLPVLSNDRLDPALGLSISVDGIGINDGTSSNAPSQGGFVTVNPGGGSIQYTPTVDTASNYVETFTYIITDGTARRSEAQVTVEIINRTNVLQAAVSDDSFTVARSSANNNLPVLSNDGIFPTRGGAWTISSVSTALYGTVSISGSNLVYTPPAGFVGEDQMTYGVNDGLGGTGTGFVNVTVGCLPTVEDTFEVMSGSSSNYLEVIGNDPRTTNTAAEYTLFAAFGADQGGTVSVVTGGTEVIYTPNPGYAGIYPYRERFVYTVSDDGTSFVTGQVNVIVHEQGSDRDTTNIYIYVDGQNDRPTITNYFTPPEIFDNETALPFTNVMFTEVDEQQQELVDITIDLDDGVILGYLTNLGSFIQTGPFRWNLSNVTFATANSQIRPIIYVPMTNHISVPDKDTAFFTLTITDNKSAPFTDTNSYVIVSSTNDPVSITNETQLIEINDQQTSQLFTNVFITEVDNLSTQAFDLTVEMDAGYKGYFTNLSGFIETDPGVYWLSNTTDDAANTSIYALVYVPYDNRISVPDQEYVFFTITANDHFHPADVNTNSVILVSATNDQVNITNDAVLIEITDKQNVVPFTNLVVNEEDNIYTQLIDIRIELDLGVKGNFSNLNGFVQTGVGTYWLSNTTMDAANYAITNLLYTPTQNRLGFPDVEDVFFTFTAYDYFHPPWVDTASVIRVTAINDAPAITNLTGGAYTITDKETALPFTNVVFTEVDRLTLESVDVVITMDDPIKGLLTNIGTFVESPAGVLTLTNVTADYAQSQITNILFIPTENRITVPLSEDTIFTVSISDNIAPPTLDTSSVIRVVSVNDAPVITGTEFGQITYFGTPISPFTNVMITEVDELEQQPQTVTITLDSLTNGSLQYIGSFTMISQGVYQATGITATGAAAEIRGMQFLFNTNGVNFNEPLLTRFTICSDDGFAAPTVCDDYTTVMSYHGQQQQVIGSPTNLLEKRRFGFAVANDDQYAVVGAPNSYDGVLPDAGKAFIYQRTGIGTNSWEEIKVLKPAGVDIQDEFGTAVDIDGNIIVVSAMTDEDALFTTAGAVYLFDKDEGGTNNWGLAKRIPCPEGAGSWRFGRSVYLDGDRLAVGASRNINTGVYSGATFIFERHEGGSNNWGLVRKVLPPVPLAVMGFGYDVALQGDFLFVGAPVLASGAAYIFERNVGGSNNWGAIQTFVSPDGVPGDHFGFALEVYDDYLVVGAPNADTEEGWKGEAYIYEKSASSNYWVPVETLLPSSVRSNDYFGYDISMSEDLLLIGAPRNNFTNQFDIGSAYLFRQNPFSTNDWLLADRLVPEPNTGYGSFGNSLHLYNGYACIGAPVNVSNATLRGTAYFYNFRLEGSFSGDDTDFDNIPDSWELANGMDPNDPSDASDDDDGDGMTNYEEYIAGTDPGDSASVLVIVFEHVDIGADDKVIRWQSRPGREYGIYYADSATSPYTNVLIMDVLATPPENAYTDQVNDATGDLFYQIRVNIP